MALLGAPADKTAEEVRLDLEQTPRWILASLKAARDEAAALRSSVEALGDAQRLHAELEQVKAGEAAKLQEFLAYVQAVETWKGRMMSSTHDRISAMNEQLQTQAARIQQLEAERSIAASTTGSSPQAIFELLVQKDQHIERLQEQLDAQAAELAELARQLRARMASRSASTSLAAADHSSPTDSGQFAALLAQVRSEQRDALSAPRMSLQQLPAALFDVDWLYKLDLHENQLDSVPDAIGQLAMLEELSLAHNAIAVFPPALTRLQRLTVLDLAGNRIGRVPDVFATALAKLQVLDLSRNAIAELPASLVAAPSLTFLDVSHNAVAALPPMPAAGWPTLVELHAANNRIAALPDDAGSCFASLAVLDLSNNQLAAVPVSLGLLAGQLQILRLGGNAPLTSVPPDATRSAQAFFSYLERTAGTVVMASASASRRLSVMLSHDARNRIDSDALVGQSRQELLLLSQPTPPRLGASSSSAALPRLSSSSSSNLAGVVTPRVVKSAAWRVETPQDVAEADVLERFKVPALNYYELYFHSAPHVNFIGEDSKSSRKSCPFVVSILQEVPADPVRGAYRALVRKQSNDELLDIPAESVKRSSKASLASGKDLIRAFQQQFYPGTTFRALPGGTNDLLLALEEDLITACFKFGVLYHADAAQSENDIYANQPTAAKRWQQFLNIIGERVPLSNWEHYAGGLDVKNGSTGEHSYYARDGGFEIMYHVGTMLPYFPDDSQQIERKRHIGNDIVVIVFVDGQHEFDPTVLTSIFTHVFFVVNVAEIDPATDLATSYRLSVLAKPGVDDCAIPLFSPPVAAAERDLRHYIIAKCVTLERAAYAAPGFAPAIRRTRREQLLEFDRGTKAAYSAGLILDTPEKPKQTPSKLPMPRLLNLFSGPK